MAPRRLTTHEDGATQPGEKDIVPAVRNGCQGGRLRYGASCRGSLNWKSMTYRYGQCVWPAGPQKTE